MALADAELHGVDADREGLVGRAVDVAAPLPVAAFAAVTRTRSRRSTSAVATT